MRAVRVSALAGVLTTMALVTPGVAQAAESTGITVSTRDVIVSSGAAVTGVPVRVERPDGATSPLTHVVVTVDVAGLAGIATVPHAYPASGACDQSGTAIKCVLDTLTSEYPVFMDVKAVAGTAAGTKGSFAVSVSADGVAASTASGTVTVAEGVNLIAGPEITLSGKPGATLAVTPEVRNAGATVAHGVVLVSSSGSASAAYQPRKYSNCVYTDEQFFCVFDQDLAAGARYTVASPIPVALTADAPAPSSFDTYAEWATPADAESFIAGIRSRGKAGTGSALTLVEKPAARAAAPQTDTSEIDNFTHLVFDVTGDNKPDLTAVGTTVRGKVGDTVKATFGIKNLGPARIDSWDEFPSALVTIPAGTTVAEADRNCVAVTGQAGTYRCLASGLDVGETANWVLSLKITDAAPGKGTITARTEIAGKDTFGPDLDASNDKAEILLNPATAGDDGDNGDDTDDNGGTGAGTGDDDGGTLPITGANTTLAAGVGVLLVLAGSILVVATRRRRAA